MNEIALYFSFLPYSEEEWSHSFHGLFMRVIQGIRQTVKDTGHLELYRKEMIIK